MPKPWERDWSVGEIVLQPHSAPVASDFHAVIDRVLASSGTRDSGAIVARMNFLIMEASQHYARVSSCFPPDALAAAHATILKRADGTTEMLVVALSYFDYSGAAIAQQLHGHLPAWEDELWQSAQRDVAERDAPAEAPALGATTEEPRALFSFIQSEDQAASVLDEVGALQRAVEAGNVGPEEGAADIVVRAKSVTKFFINQKRQSIFGVLVEPLAQWSFYALASKSLVLSWESPEGAAYKAAHEKVMEFYNGFAYLEHETVG